MKGKGMMDLLSLRRWVIQQDQELTFREKATGRAWKLSPEGVLKYSQPTDSGTPQDHTPEQIFQLADEFILVDRAKTQTLTRSELELLLGKTMRKPAPASDEARD
jgi:hypothetical protein